MSFEALKLDLRVTDVMWVGLFNHIEVWRSRQGSGGPYEEVTGPAWTPASFSFLARPYVVVGKTLSLLVNETNTVTVIFTGSDPLSASTIASQIQTQSLGLLTAASNGSAVNVNTLAPGAVASLRVLSSDAAGIFGLQSQDPSNIHFGRDARVALVKGQESYAFVDPNGDRSFFYKIRFFNNLNNTVSEFSDPFQVQRGTALDGSRLVTGAVDLFDVDGTSLRNIRVLIYSQFTGTVIDNSVVAGTTLEALTDENGHASFTLVRGSKVSVAIAGTSLVRNITVPTDTGITTFDLLDPSIADPDVFTVQVPEMDWATRRSL